MESYAVACGEVDCLRMTQAYFGGILVDLNQSNCCEFAKYGVKTIVNRLLTMSVNINRDIKVLSAGQKQ